MRQFEKSRKLDNVLYDVRGPVVDEANRMIENGMEVLRLNIGNPATFGFSAPEEVILDMMSSIRDSQGYSDSKGIFSARKAIMQYCQLKGIPNVGMNDIYTGNGVSELINLCMSALLDDGDEILIPAPDYPLWTATANLAGGKAVHYICDEQANWYPDIEDMKKKVKDWENESEVESYLIALLNQQVFDRAGLIYGMGHAVYSISDPRARTLRKFVEKLAEEKGMQKEFALYNLVEKLAPKVIANERHIYKGVSANIDFYSGLVYSMLGIPHELYTPLFAIGRIAGWSAHRLEELVNAGKIIRPAYKAVAKHKPYTPLNERE